MEIKVRSLNKGECFCCSMKSAKEMFKNTPIKLNFAYYSRDYKTFAETTDSYFLKRNISGRVVVSFYMHSGLENPSLNFYVIKEINYSEKLRMEFEKTYLTALMEFYRSMLVESFSNLVQTKVMLVELLDENFKSHTISLR